MKTRFFGVSGPCDRGYDARARRCIQLCQGAAIALLLASTVQPAAASSVVVDTYFDELYNFNGEPLQQNDFLDHGESGSIEASTSSTFDPASVNMQGGEVKRLNSYAAGELGAAHLEADAFFSIPTPSGDFDRYDANGQTKITIDDLILTGPTAQVTTKINFLVEGTLHASSEVYMAGTGTNVGASATFGATVQVGNGTDYPTVIGNGTYNLESNGDSPATGSGNGLFANFTGHNVVTTDSVTLPVGTPITLIITASLLANAGADGDSAGSAESEANFGNTFSFATDEPVFDLPDGYTANSLSAAIFANEYVGDDESVPEPSTVSMLLGAAVMVGVVGFRRRAGRVA